MEKKKQEPLCMCKQFEKISEKTRSELKADLCEAIVKHFRKEKIEEEYYQYEVQLQENRFFTEMSDEELEKSANLTIDVLEELKEINNNGLLETKFRESVEKIEKSEENEAIRIMKTWNVLCSENMVKIIGEIDHIRRVGGAYAFLIANPILKNAIYAVYDRVVDQFDDEALYCHCAFFLLRAIMMMHSDAINRD